MSNDTTFQEHHSGAQQQNHRHHHPNARAGGDKLVAYLPPGHIHAMHARSSESALTYVAVILVCYLVGMLVLLLHHVRQKYGQITLYDIYYELAPSAMVNGGGGGGNSNSTGGGGSTAEGGKNSSVAGGGGGDEDEIDEELEDQRLLEQGRRRRNRPSRNRRAAGERNFVCFPQCFPADSILRRMLPCLSSGRPPPPTVGAAALQQTRLSDPATASSVPATAATDAEMEEGDAAVMVVVHKRGAEAAAEEAEDVRAREDAVAVEETAL